MALFNCVRLMKPMDLPEQFATTAGGNVQTYSARTFLRLPDVQRSGSVLLLHVPKTGGTSVDSMLADYFPSDASLAGVQHGDPRLTYEALYDPSKRYISGHFPYSAIARRPFDLRMTVIRQPREVLNSLLAYSRKIGETHGELAHLLSLEQRFSVYGAYFSMESDFQHYLLERRFGLAKGYRSYVNGWDLQETLAELRNFKYVFSFERLADEIKAFVLAERFFPPSIIPNKRKYLYAADHELVNKLTSPDDDAFFEAVSSEIFKPPAASGYEEYRADYCQTKGLRMRRGDAGELDLAGPIGAGWSRSEKTDAGATFRWSDSEQASLDIPVSEPGRYRVNAYFYNALNTQFEVQALLWSDQKAVECSRSTDSNFILVAATFDIPRADWLTLSFQIEIPDAARQTFEERALGLNLAAIYITRLA
jgi:hypothetical protein